MTMSVADRAAECHAEARRAALRLLVRDGVISPEARTVLRLLDSAGALVEEAAEGQRIGVAVIRNGPKARAARQIEGWPRDAA